LNGASPRIMRLKLISLAFLIALLAQSCGIDFQTRAVDKARNYALDNLKQLNETQRSFIRYTDPVIMDRVIYRMNNTGRYCDLLHVCMVWKVPGMDSSIVVAGHAERSLLEWNPDRIIIEDLTAPDSIIAKNQEDAIIFAMNRMLSLSDAERNHIRFTPAEIYKTKFALPEDETKDENRTLSRWEAYLKSKEKKPEPIQYSVVWKMPPNGTEAIVISGLAPSEKSTGKWKPATGMKISVAELDAMKISGNLAPVWPQEQNAKK